MTWKDVIFQSTLPAWGATVCSWATMAQACNFNPRSPQGERPDLVMACYHPIDFNPRSPQGERQSGEKVKFHFVDFNPRSVAIEFSSYNNWC